MYSYYDSSYDSGYGTGISASQQKIGWDDALNAGVEVLTSIFGSRSGGGSGSDNSGSNEEGSYSQFPFPYPRRPVNNQNQQTGNQQSAASQLIVPISIFVVGAIVIVILFKKL